MATDKSTNSIREFVSLRYSGPDVDSGMMDAYSAAGNIVAFADFVGAAAQSIYGPSAKLKTDVRAFNQGSFEVNFAVDYVGVAATLISSVSPKDLWEVAKQTFEIWKVLKSEEPKSVTHLESNQVKIESNTGTIIIVRPEAYATIANPNASDAATRFAKTALQGDVESVSIEQPGGTIVSVSKEESQHIGFTPEATTLTENELTIWLLLESPVFKDNNKWKFNNGAQSFSAAIEDKAFLERVNSGAERFGKGDRMLVRMIQMQTGSLASMRTEYKIAEVLEPARPAC